MIIKNSSDSLKILATYSPEHGIHVTASAVAEQLGDTFSTHIIERKDPRFVYAIARAVTADVPNKNHDLFPIDEIKRAYTSFIGRNMFLDHNTKSVRNAVGKIVAAELREDEEGQTYVACLFKIDRELHPDIARKIENGIIDSVSMGANVQEAECSQCHARASREADFCEHLKNMHLHHDVYSINHGVEFTELSLVSVPADPTAKMHKVFNLQNGIEKVAIATETPAEQLAENSEETDTDQPKSNVQLEQEDVNINPETQPITNPIPEQKSDVTIAKPDGTFFKIDCSSNESAELIFNIFYPYLNKEVETLELSGRGIVIQLSDMVKVPLQFIQEACVMFGLGVQTGAVQQRTADLYNGLVVEAKKGREKGSREDVKKHIKELLSLANTYGTNDSKTIDKWNLICNECDKTTIKSILNSKEIGKEDAIIVSEFKDMLDKQTKKKKAKKSVTHKEDYNYETDNSLSEETKSDIGYLISALRSKETSSSDFKEILSVIKDSAPNIDTGKIFNQITKDKDINKSSEIFKILEQQWSHNVGKPTDTEETQPTEQKPSGAQQTETPAEQKPAEQTTNFDNVQPVKEEKPKQEQKRTKTICTFGNGESSGDIVIKQTGDNRYIATTHNKVAFKRGDNIYGTNTDFVEFLKKQPEIANVFDIEATKSGQAGLNAVLTPKEANVTLDSIQDLGDITDRIPKDMSNTKNEEKTIESQNIPGDSKEIEDDDVLPIINLILNEYVDKDSKVTPEFFEKIIKYNKSIFYNKESYSIIKEKLKTSLKDKADAGIAIMDDIINNKGEQSMPNDSEKKQDYLDYVTTSYPTEKMDPKEKYNFTNDLVESLMMFDTEGKTWAAFNDILNHYNFKSEDAKKEFYKEVNKYFDESVKGINPIPAWTRRKPVAQNPGLATSTDTNTPEQKPGTDQAQHASTTQTGTTEPVNPAAEQQIEKVKEEAEKLPPSTKPTDQTEVEKLKEAVVSGKEEEIKKTLKNAENPQKTVEQSVKAIEDSSEVNAAFINGGFKALSDAIGEQQDPNKNQPNETPATPETPATQQQEQQVPEAKKEEQKQETEQKLEQVEQVAHKLDVAIRKISSIKATFAGQSIHAVNAVIDGIDFDALLKKIAHLKANTDQNTYVLNEKIEKEAEKALLQFKNAWGLLGGKTKYDPNAPQNPVLEINWESDDGTCGYRLTAVRNGDTNYNCICRITKAKDQKSRIGHEITKDKGTIVEALDAALYEAIQIATGKPNVEEYMAKKEEPQTTTEPTEKQVPTTPVEQNPGGANDAGSNFDAKTTNAQVNSVGIITEGSIFDMLTKVATTTNDLNKTPTEIEVTEESKEGVLKESSMNEEMLKEEACGTNAAEKPELEAQAAKDKEEETPFAEEPEEEIEETKDGEKGEGEDKKVEISEKDHKEAEKALNAVLKNELAEQAEGEEEGEDVKNIKKALGLLNMKEEKTEEPKEETPESEEAGIPPLGEEEASEDNYNPFASLKATFVKKATIADSLWQVKTASNEDYLTFAVKAAFGNNIDNDTTRSSYATSEEFGKAVVASLINNKVETQTAAAAAVLGVVAHYTPSHEGVNKFKDNKQSSHSKASGEGDKETDKNLMAEKTASTVTTITKQASEGECCQKDTYLPGADSRSIKEGTSLEESAHQKATEKVETTTDKHIIASYEEQLKKQAEEIQNLKLEATIKEKTAKVQEAVNMMVRAGLIKANDQVRVAGLKDGLSIEAANAKAMAASIDAQSKNLFGMNSAQLDSYIHSLAALSPRTQVVTASAKNEALTVKASFAESEVDRLSKLLGWD